MRLTWNRQVEVRALGPLQISRHSCCLQMSLGLDPALVSIHLFIRWLLLGYMPGLVSGVLRTSSGASSLSMFVSIPGKESPLQRSNQKESQEGIVCKAVGRGYGKPAGAVKHSGVIFTPRWEGAREGAGPGPGAVTLEEATGSGSQTLTPCSCPSSDLLPVSPW